MSDGLRSDLPIVKIADLSRDKLHEAKVLVTEQIDPSGNSTRQMTMDEYFEFLEQYWNVFRAASVAVE